jgi:hypothetical protein
MTTFQPSLLRCPPLRSSEDPFFGALLIPAGPEPAVSRRAAGTPPSPPSVMLPCPKAYHRDFSRAFPRPDRPGPANSRNCHGKGIARRSSHPRIGTDFCHCPLPAPAPVTMDRTAMTVTSAGRGDVLGTLTRAPYFCQMDSIRLARRRNHRGLDPPFALAVPEVLPPGRWAIRGQSWRSFSITRARSSITRQCRGNARGMGIHASLGSLNPAQENPECLNANECPPASMFLIAFRSGWAASTRLRAMSHRR